MKIVIIGCTHAGTAVAVNSRKLYPNSEIVIYERNNNISFLSCGIALYVGGVVKDAHGLFYNSPENLKSMNVTTNMEHDVLDIDFENKKIIVKDLKNNEEKVDTFDKLVLTTGSWPIIPPLEGINSKNILLSKNYNHSNKIIETAKSCKKIAVIGAGYIGVELVEAFRENGKEVVLIDRNERIMSKYLDEEYTNIAENELRDQGIVLGLGEGVKRFEANENGYVSKVVTDKNEYEVDMVILCIGFKPNTDLVANKLDTLPNGAIIVNEYMETSAKDVFAAGDCATVFYNPTNSVNYIPLATNAVRQGTIVAQNLDGHKVKSRGTQGTSAIKVFRYNIASTGLNEETAKDNNVEYEVVTLKDSYRPEFMPTHEEFMLKVLYEKSSRVILGGQIISKADLTQSVNTLSVCIQNKMTIEDLAYVDFFFQPHYNKPWNYLNTAGLNANK